VTEAIVASALLGVREHRVCLAALFELLFRLRIVRVAVRMVLHRQLAIGALDLLVGGRAAHSQNFVIVSFDVCSQNDFLTLPAG